MSTPYVTDKSESHLTIAWDAPTGTDTGNSDITTYTLYWDDNTDTVNVELVDNLVLTYTVTGLTAGEDYKFEVRAKNIYGYGANSATLTADASDIPAQMDPPTVTIPTSRRLSAATDSVNVKVTWTAPDAHSAAIDGYEIAF